ncbi:MAG: N,N-dimethylformamidase beta subunit family domain-containing protein [Actinomycetota bacterium]
MVEAYVWPQSYRPGERVGLRISSDADRVDVAVRREGATPEIVRQLEGIVAAPQAIPDDASAGGCDWEPAASVEAPDRSGMYTVTVSAGDERAETFFVVRPDPADPAPIVLVLSTATYNAYNDWGGPSLYTGGTRVSFDRPLAPGFVHKPEPARKKTQPDPDREAHYYFEWAEPNGLSVWSGGSGWWNWERPFLAWAQAEGFAVDIAVSQDLELHPEVLEGHRLYASVGHDEYWSWAMRDAVEGFVAGGGNAVFLTGNTSYWQVRPADGFRAMTCFKYGADDDPVIGTDDERRLSGAWSDRRIARPENAMTGLSFTRGGYSRYGLGVPRASGGFTVWRPDHWAFEGSDLRYGDLLGGADTIAAYELDGCELQLVDGLPVPTHADAAPEGLEVLATAPARLWKQDEQPSRYSHEPGELEHVAMALWGEDWEQHARHVTNNHAVIGTFGVPNGGTVFTAGCTDWAYGIEGGDAAVRRITRNVLDRLSA